MNATRQSQATRKWYRAATSAAWVVVGTAVVFLGVAMAREARDTAAEALDQFTQSVARAEQALRRPSF